MPLNKRPFAKKAIVLHAGSLGSGEYNVSRILEFFSIPHFERSIAELCKSDGQSGQEFKGCAVLASLDMFRRLLKSGDNGTGILDSAEAAYFYASDDLSACSEALRILLGIQKGSFALPPDDIVRLSISSDFPELTGPMTGLQVSLKLGQDDFICDLAAGSHPFVPVITANNAPVFLAGRLGNTPCFIAASSKIVDIDAPVAGEYYDVKTHYCSAVPLVMFLKYVFSRVMWQPVENGACLIIDDPLLRTRYGHCDFIKLLQLMKAYGFATDISFIPWNWWRTSKRNAEFFLRESDQFSVSIHGCDHIAAEFGETDSEVLAGKARLAQSRMRQHQERCGFRHESIMVFPQGVFSAECPEVLKRTNFISAVNTDVSPVGNTDNSALIKDVWDVAITKYGSFPIFTRRYDFHGLENFAFDLLLGKPCLVVAHHEFFKHECQAMLELIEKLSSLKADLKWRPLGEVVRRACRRRVTPGGVYEYWMYANELRVKNDSIDQEPFIFKKWENDPDSILKIESSDGEVTWKSGNGEIEISIPIPGGAERLFKVVYKDYPKSLPWNRTLKYQVQVAARRFLSELRDEAIFHKDRLK